LIKEPKYDPAKWVVVKGDAEKTKVSCEYQPAKVYTAYNPGLEKKSPKVYQFVQNFYIPIEEMYDLIADAEEAPGNPKQGYPNAARNWLKAHPEIIKDWMKGIE